MLFKLQREKNYLSKMSDEIGNFICFIMENPLKAIPAGTYEIGILYSPRFKRYNPHILNVPGRSFIEMHTANRPDQLEGCLAPGMILSGPGIGKSVDAYDLVVSKIDNYIFSYPMAQTGPINIEISDAL